jgi:APA family basic amino acid/polyamine antiporter
MVKKLKKHLTLINVYAIATGTTLSAGFFLLPGMAAREAGPAMVIAYMLAAVPLVPAMFCIAELSTAMPKAGGVYYFLDRTLGPLVGTIGGIGTWLVLMLKVSFALVGMGYYITLYYPDAEMKWIAVSVALVLGVLNLFSSKKSGNFQLYLVFGLLVVLIYFLITGVPVINWDIFQSANFFSKIGENGEVEAVTASTVLATAGLVYISYVGVTKVASLAEEVKEPERNLPMGIFLSLGTSILIYLIGTMVMVGVVPLEQLRSTFTPVADAAFIIGGDTGMMILSLGAILAFVSVANAGILSASRYPLAMGRDHIMPSAFRKIDKNGIPVTSVLVTVALIIAAILFLEPLVVAKLASAFQLLIFAFICLTVIVMRESHLKSYDPGYKSPFYPWMQLLGIIAPIFFIAGMGFGPITFAIGLITAGTWWYFYYVNKKTERRGAIFHVFDRLGQERYDGLDAELRGILKDKGLRDHDPFDDIISRCFVIDVEEGKNFEDVSKMASELLAKKIHHNAEEINKQFMDGTRIGATPVTHGVALPHFRTDGIENIELVLVRSKTGIDIVDVNPLTHHENVAKKATAIFFLISPEDKPNQHLRILAHIAKHVDQDNFMKDWISVKGEVELKELLMRDERFFSLVIEAEGETADMMGRKIKEINFPDKCLVVMLSRGDEIKIPDGGTVIFEGDRLTIVGEPEAIKEAKKFYG